MGTCSYCGQKAGFLRSSHPECLEKFKKGCEQVLSLASSAAKGERDPFLTKEEMQQVASCSFISPGTLKQTQVQAWEQTLHAFLANSLLTKEEETNLMKYASALELSHDDLNKNGALLLATQSAIIRDMTEGKLPARVTIDGAMPFNLQKGETIVWYEKGCRYMEEKTFRSYVGGYQGVSVRLARGLYYRTGGFKGHPIETDKMVQLDAGVLAITDKHLYFAGTRKSFRVPYPKIVSFVPYSDGFGIFKEAANSKQQVFVTGNGWFFINLVENLAKL